MGFLFERGGLEQDTGRIAERWNQEGSELKSAATSFTTTAGVILTVSAGKKFYMKTLSFQCGNGASTNDTLTDGSGGTLKMYLQSLAADGLYSINFDTPVAFTTSVYHTSASGIWKFTVTGWEEDA